MYSLRSSTGQSVLNIVLGAGEFAFYESTNGGTIYYEVLVLMGVVTSSFTKPDNSSIYNWYLDTTSL